MNNFKAHIPIELQKKMEDFADCGIELINDYHSFDGPVIPCEMFDEIQGNYCDGWLPRQDGGFSVNAYYRSDEDSSYHFTEKQSDEMNRLSNQLWKDFLSDEGLPADIDYESLNDLDKETLCNYECNYFEPALLSLEIFCDDNTESYYSSEEKLVTIRLSINYSDAPYYREKYAEDIKQLVYTFDEFMALDNADIIKLLK